MLTMRVGGLDVAVGEFQALPDLVRKATVRSLNRAIVSGQALMSRLVAQDAGLKVGDVKHAFRLQQASDARPTASLSAGAKRLPLVQFSARGPEPSRGKGRGVSYKLQGGRGVLANAFIATMKTGHRGVFMRKGKARLPIRELFGPSIAKVFIKYQPQGQARAEASFLGNFEHEMSRIHLTPNPALLALLSNDNADAAA